MQVNIIVASCRGGAIGRSGDLVRHISADLKHFKDITTGHPVIMGRKTWESLPKRPLPGRRNIIITRDPLYKAEGAEIADSPRKALELLGDEDSPFIIGGGEIYNAFLPLASTLYLTEIDADAENADTFFHIPPEDWTETERSETFTSPDGENYSFVTLRRK